MSQEVELQIMAQAEAIGEQCRVKRAIERITLRDAAKSIGVSTASLCRLESGKQPTFKTFMLVLSWLRGYPLEQFKV